MNRCNSNSRNLYCFTIALFVSYLLTLVALYRPIWTNIYPTMDEFALISSSKRISLDWFTSGYSDYFVVYPEWYYPFTDFLRPVANFTYWIFSPWSEIGFRLQLISVNYFVHAAIASTIFFAGVHLFKNDLLQSFLISLSVFFCAAFFNTPMPQYPTFALDAIAGFFCLCAILALVKRRDVLCVFFMVAALFTKESSLPIFGAMVLYGFYDKNFKRSFYVISILLVWASLRFYSYNGFGATPALSSGFDIQRLASLSLIPFGYFEVGQLKNIIILRDITLYNILYLVANIIFYFFLAKCTIRHFFIDAKKKSFTGGKVIDIRYTSTLLYMCAIISITYFALTNGSARFMYVLIVVLALLLATSLRHVPIYVHASIMLISAIGALHSYNNVDNDLLHHYYKSAKALIWKIRDVNSAGKDIYIGNDFVTGFSSPKKLADFANVSNEIVRINSIDCESCSVADMGRIETTVSKNNGQIILNISLPSCAKFAFEGANPELMKYDSSGYIKRNDDISYRFPEMSYVPRILGHSIIDYGKKAEIHINNLNNIVIYDFKESQWVSL